MEIALTIALIFMIVQSVFLIYLGTVILKTNHQDDTPIIPPLKPLFKAKPKPTEEEIKYSKILANIDAYDGSGKGQSKV